VSYLSLDSLHRDWGCHGGQRVFNYVEAAAKLFLADDQRRLHAHHIPLLAAHADEDAALAAQAPPGGRNRRPPDDDVAALGAAEAAVAACGQAGPRGTEPAREAGRLVSDVQHLSVETQALAVPDKVRRRVVQLLNYHSELIGQASLMAYGNRTERTLRAIGKGGLGPLARELQDLADAISRMPPPGSGSNA